MGSQSVRGLRSGQDQTVHSTLHTSHFTPDMNNKIIIIIGLLCTIGSGAEGLRCWECDSDDHDCDDVSNHRDKQCESESVCNRLVLNGKVNLDCAAGEGISLGCRRRGGDDNVQCYCDSDLCNAGWPAPHLSLLLLLLTLALSGLALQ